MAERHIWIIHDEVDGSDSFNRFCFSSKRRLISVISSINCFGSCSTEACLQSFTLLSGHLKTDQRWSGQNRGPAALGTALTSLNCPECSVNSWVGNTVSNYQIGAMLDSWRINAALTQWMIAELLGQTARGSSFRVRSLSFSVPIRLAVEAPSPSAYMAFE